MIHKLLIIVMVSLFFQGDLPYWANKKKPTQTGECKQYRLYRTSSNTAISTTFMYFNCDGVFESVIVGGLYGDQAVVCATGTPILSQYPPAEGSIPVAAAVEDMGKCGGDPDPDPDPEKPVDPGVPVVGCGTKFNFRGGKAYPSSTIVDLGEGVGTVTVDFVTFNVPDKIIVRDPNRPVPLSQVIAHSGGYYGATNMSSYLCGYYSSRGYGCPGCQGIFTPPELKCNQTVAGSGSFTFTKTSGLRWVYVDVYAPFDGTAWEVSVSCAD